MDVLSSLKMEVTFTPIIETDTTIARKTDVHINSNHFIRSDILLFTFSFLSIDELLINRFPLLFGLQMPLCVKTKIQSMLKMDPS